MPKDPNGDADGNKSADANRVEAPKEVVKKAKVGESK